MVVMKYVEWIESEGKPENIRERRKK